MKANQNKQITAPAALPAPPAVAAATPRTVAELEAENARLSAEVATLRAVKEAESAEEILIRERMELGLSRAHAVAVVRRQRAFDESEHGKKVRARHEARQANRKAV